MTSPASLAATAVHTGEHFPIIGAQFQKSPLGIVSRASDPVQEVGDLSGRRLAVPTMNEPLVLDVLGQSGLDASNVELSHYDHGPLTLIDGEVQSAADHGPVLIGGQSPLGQAFARH